MKEIINLLETARFHIDGQMNCNTPEYHALDHLHRAVDLLAGKIQRQEDREANAATSANP